MYKFINDSEKYILLANKKHCLWCKNVVYIYKKDITNITITNKEILIFSDKPLKDGDYTLSPSILKLTEQNLNKLKKCFELVN